MEEEKKNTSFLYNLFHRYKDDKDNAQDSPNDLAKEIIEGALADTVDSDILVAAEQETVAEVTEVTCPDPDSKETPKMGYLEPLFKVYSDLAKATPGFAPMYTLQSFEAWIMTRVEALPFFTQHRQEITKFLREICKLTEVMQINLTADESLYELQLQQYHASIEALPPNETRRPPMPSMPSVDATVHICVTGDKMHALIFLLPPYRGGKEADEERLLAELKKNRIVYGTIQPLLDDIAKGAHYLQFFLIADGVFPVNGQDGQVIHEIDCSDEIEMQEDEHGNVDFRNLNRFHTVEKDDVICKIIPEVEGIAGKNLYGDKLVPPTPKKPLIPIGKNTIVSKDGSQLLSCVGGHIQFRNGRYNVEEVLIIKSNVDYSVGNLDFPGNIIVYGDVCTGFRIKAQGNITIYGMVENASVTAGGDVFIQKGMNGNHTGVIDAIGSVKASFLENCIVYCGGALRSDSIISCKVYCEDTVSVLGARGVIIGGTITAFRSVEARMIGSKSRRETDIILGEMPRMLTKKGELQKELKEVNSTIDKLTLNVNYLNTIKENMPEEKRTIYMQLLNQQELYSQRKQQLEEELTSLNSISLDYNSCFVKCNMVFPITRVFIGSYNYMVDTVLSKCRISFSDGEIHQGSF